MSSTFWNRACNTSISRSLQSNLEATNACSGVTIAAFCVCAAVSGTLNVLWKRADKTDKRRVWSVYGSFIALTFAGSCFGALAWSANMRYLVSFFTVQNMTSGFLDPNLTLPQIAALATQIFTMSAQQSRWLAAYYVLYALEFMCLSVAKLMMLHRMTDFAITKDDQRSRQLVIAGRIVMACVVVGNLVGLGGNIGAALDWSRKAQIFDDLAAAMSASNSNLVDSLRSQLDGKSSQANIASSVQEFSEVVVLLLIIAAFSVAGIMSLRRISSALDILADEANAAGILGRQLQRKIGSTVVFVFVTFLLRAVFSVMNALADALNNAADAINCSSSASQCDNPCLNVYTLMQLWFTGTPEVQLLIILISSPLSMLVALWGMTSDRTLDVMLPGKSALQHFDEMRPVS